MGTPERQCARTAFYASSIWRLTPEDTFRSSIVKLEQCTNAVPLGPEEFPIAEDADLLASTSIKARLLPLEVEQCLADDIATTVAVEQGAQSVAAVCIEEHADGQGMTVRLAAMDAIHRDLQELLHTIFDRLAICSQLPNVSVDEEHHYLFKLIIGHHHARILSRLRSSKWVKPSYLSRSHKKPLWQDFENLMHRVQFLYTKKERSERNTVEQQLDLLSGTYEFFEHTEPGTSAEQLAFERLIESSYCFCNSDSARSFARRLTSSSSPTAQVAAAIKCLHQIEKIAAYWRIITDLISCARKFPSLFQKVECKYLAPYSPVETTIAYETWAKVCHIHAEVQLAVHYDTSLQLRDDSQPMSNKNSPITLNPRCIGTSKYLCYLCYLFLKSRNQILARIAPSSSHIQLHIANTHGRLYDQWTIPDLTVFEPTTVEIYQNIVSDMTYDIQKLTQQVMHELETEQPSSQAGRGNSKHSTPDGKLVKWRAEPMTSRENLLLVEG